MATLGIEQDPDAGTLTTLADLGDDDELGEHAEFLRADWPVVDQIAMALERHIGHAPGPHPTEVTVLTSALREGIAAWEQVREKGARDDVRLLAFVEAVLERVTVDLMIHQVVREDGSEWHPGPGSLWEFQGAMAVNKVPDEHRKQLMTFYSGIAQAIIPVKIVSILERAKRSAT